MHIGEAKSGALFRIQPVQPDAVIVYTCRKEEKVLPPHFMLHRGIILILDFFHHRDVAGGIRSGTQRRQLPPAAGNRSGSRAGEDIAAGRAHIKLEPVHPPRIRAVWVQLPLEQLEYVRSQHFCQFLPKGSVRASQAGVTQLKTSINLIGGVVADVFHYWY